jgi:hypothetical protein
MPDEQLYQKKKNPPLVCLESYFSRSSLWRAQQKPPGRLESKSRSLGHSSLRRIPRKPYTKNLDANN